MKIIVISFVFGILSIVLAIVSAIFFLCGSDIAGAIGVFSTIVSTILGVISIVYTYVSGNKTIELLDQIKEQYKNLVGKVQAELVSENFDEQNLKNLRDKQK